MPSLPLRPCPHPTCPALVSSGYCDRHQQAAKAVRKEQDSLRPNAHQRGYANARWKAFRRWFLQQEQNVVCSIVRLDASLTCRSLSEHVHHLVKVRDDRSRMFDPTNCVGLCHSCHSILTARGL